MAYQQGPDHPSMGGPPPRPPSPWSSPPVLIAIIAGLVLLIGGVTAAVVYSKNSSSTVAADSSGVPEPATVTVPPPTSDQPSPTEPTPEPRPSDPTPIGDSGASPITVPGADRQGFAGQPRCNAAGDDAVFIGLTDRSQVVICQVGTLTGRYYYKGVADGKGIEIDYPTRSGDTFVATNDGVEYIVTPTALTIRQNGSILTVEPMRASWVSPR